MANQKYTPVGFYNETEDTNTFFATYTNMSVFFQDDNSPVATTRPVDPIESNIAGLGSRDVRGQYKGVTWRLYVKLLAADETNVQEMYRLFSEEDGLKWLVVSDGQSPVVQWRTQVRILGIERIAQTKNLFAVVLRCANPIWKAHSDISRTRTLPVLTLSGKELNNATRGDPEGAFTDYPYEGDYPWAGSGTPTFVPFSCGIYEATTNLLINGGFESGTTGWGTSGTNTIAQSQDQSCFGFDVCKVTYGNTASVLIERTASITFGGATQHTASCWIY